MKIIIIIILSIIVISPNTLCQERSIGILPSKKSDSHQGKTYAFIVGISEYKHIKPLNYADKDAELFAGFLQTTAGGSVKPENLMLLTNENAKSGDFISAFQKIVSKPKAGDRLYFYFAGHGDGDKRKNKYYLLLSDVQPAGDANSYSYNNSALNIADIKDDLGTLVRDSVEVIMIIDACRTNELPGGYTSQIVTENVLEKRVGEIMMSATGQGQVSIESPTIGNGHGLFTYTLVDGLAGEADKGEYSNPDGSVSLSELQNWVQGRVKRIAELKFKTKQEPYFCCGDKNGVTMSTVDSSFYRHWKYAKANEDNLENVFVNWKPFTGRNDKEAMDSTITELYKRFSDAIKNKLLIGDSSANFFYKKLRFLYPNIEVTKNAGMTLAAELINGTQQKINQYLEGKDEYNIQRDFSENSLSRNDEGLIGMMAKNQIRISQTDWGKASEMFDLALDILSQYGTEINKTLLIQSYFLKARSFIPGSRESDYRMSLQYAHRAYSLDSSTAYIVHILAMSLLDNELYDSALYFERKTIQLASHWTQAYLGMGYFFSDMNKRDSALLYFNKAIALNPNMLSPYLGKVPIFTWKTDSDSVSVIMREIKGRFVRSSMEAKSWPSFLKKMGRAYEDLELYDSALVYYQNCAKENPSQDYIYIGIGNVFFNRGMYDSAIAYYKKCFLKQREKEDAYYNLGVAFSGLKNYDSAFFYLRQLIVINPDFEACYHKLGHIFYDLKMYDSALHYFKMMILYSNRYEYSFVDAGNVFDEMNLPDSAMYYYRKAVSVNPKYEYSYNGIGNIFRKKDKNDSALYYYKCAIKLNPQFEGAYSNLGRFFFDIEEFDSAVAYYKMTIDLNPEKEDVFNNIGYVFLKSRDYDSASKYFQLSIAANAKYEYPYYNLGKLNYQRRKYDTAVLNYKMSIALSPSFRFAYYNIGLAYRDIKNLDSAIYYFKKSLSDSGQYHYSCLQLSLCYSLVMNYDSSLEYMKKMFVIETYDSVKYEKVEREFRDVNDMLSNGTYDSPRIKENSLIYFNLACIFSLKKDLWKSEMYLERAISHGFNQLARIKNSTDLESLKKSDRFENMMQHYFKSEWKN